MTQASEAAYAWVAQAIQAREELIAQVRSGEIALVDAFATAQTDPLVGRAFAVKVLEAVPGIGKVRARRTMASLGLAEDLTMADVEPVAQFDIAVAFSSE